MNKKFSPNFAVPPGETLLETIDALGMTQAELSQRMGRPLKTINEIIKGKAAITADTSLQLEKVLGIPASFWNNAEQNFREALARIAEQKRLEDQSIWLHDVPWRSLVELNWIKQFDEPAQQLEAFLQYFGVASPSAWRSVWGDSVTKRLAVEFRKSPAFQSNWVSLAAWLRKGELEAQEIKCRIFDATAFKSALHQIRTMTARLPGDFQQQVTRLCANAGVALVFVPPLPKTHVSGATHWPSSNKAILQLSLRGKYDDLLWFSFFHEAGHILLHGKKDVFIEDHGKKSDKEEEANQFSANFLIPPSDWNRFSGRPRTLSKADVCAFAAELGIAPGIVVGRLQHEGILPRSHFNDLKVRFDFAENGNNN